MNLMSICTQADKLAKRRQLLEDIAVDLEANPAAPPSWLRHGACLGTEILVGGKAREVQCHRWTDEGYFIVTEEAPFPISMRRQRTAARFAIRRSLRPR
ncbi:hypothetical protein [Paracoccus zhejiangensis]|uniref:hypothetical protein n=1 Tax=Paracoccus zhejiangensis TaxID=1077935 RepID=UPI0012FFED60|nr:hypothetical protein [Paracoccus zhejiangensis]